MLSCPASVFILPAIGNNHAQALKPAFCLFLLLTACVAAQNGTPEASAQEAKLVVLEHLWNDAQVHPDSHALEALIADRFVDTEYDGEVSQRDKFLADIKDPEFKPSAMNIRDVHTARFTDTWIFENGRWLCVASHSSLLKK